MPPAEIETVCDMVIPRGSPAAALPSDTDASASSGWVAANAMRVSRASQAADMMALSKSSVWFTNLETADARGVCFCANIHTTVPTAGLSFMGVASGTRGLCFPSDTNSLLGRYLLFGQRPSIHTAKNRQKTNIDAIIYDVNYVVVLYLLLLVEKF